MNSRDCILALTLCAMTPSIYAAMPHVGTDNFNTNDTSNWTIETPIGGGQLQITNLQIDGHLTYTAQVPSGQDFQAWSWINVNQPATDWTFQIDVHMPGAANLPIPQGDFVFYGLTATNAANQSVYGYVSASNPMGTPGRRFTALTPNADPNNPPSTSITSDVSAVQLSFNHLTDDLSVNYDPDGPDALGHYSWINLAVAPGFGESSVAVFGQSQNLAVSGDTVYGDNVRAVPEPSTYAFAFAGIGLIGWLARRAKLQQRHAG